MNGKLQRNKRVELWNWKSQKLLMGCIHNSWKNTRKYKHRYSRELEVLKLISTCFTRCSSIFIFLSPASLFVYFRIASIHHGVRVCYLCHCCFKHTKLELTHLINVQILHSLTFRNKHDTKIPNSMLFSIIRTIHISFCCLISIVSCIFLVCATSQRSWTSAFLRGNCVGVVATKPFSLDAVEYTRCTIRSASLCVHNFCWQLSSVYNGKLKYRTA